MTSPSKVTTIQLIMKKKMPYGLKLYLIEKTGSTYHEINKVLSGTSTNVELMQQVNKLLAEYNQIQQEIQNNVEAAQ